MQITNTPILFSIALCVFCQTSPPLHGETESNDEPQVQFNRDIRPILSDNCFQCHGPDKAQRKADLRLDQEKNVFAKREGYHILQPGDLDKSELWHRITAPTKAGRMPPHRTGKKLTKKQIGMIGAWIKQGAKYQKHWSLIPPQRPALPEVKDEQWPRNAIDYFVLAKLEQAGLTPSPEADRRTLIRRVTLDLTGLPPTIEEVNAFVNDNSPNAYEKVVDRLLSSSRYGERMALPWLDAARYADTNGYQADGERHMWRWRDWVINAFNQNMPFDQFTIEQLAGDLLANPTLNQLIATGFNRNHRGNAEGGIIPEEYLVEYAVDRLDTTATVWLGMTVGCARCHDHKYDPITQKEFYSLMAYFNNIPEKGKVVRFGNSPPFIKAPTKEQQAKLKKMEASIKDAKSHCAGLEDELEDALAKWEQSARNGPAIEWTLTEGLAAHYRMDGTTTDATQSNQAGKFSGGKEKFGEGIDGQAAALDGKRFVDLGKAGRLGFYDKFSLSAWIYPKTIKGGAIFSKMEDNDRSAGYSLTYENGHIHLNLARRWLDDAMRVQTAREFKPGQWLHVLATYDGSRFASGVHIYVNGTKQELKINLDDLNQNFETDEPLRIGAGAGNRKRFTGLIDDVRIYERCLDDKEAALVATADSISDIIQLAKSKRSPAQSFKLRRYFLEQHAPEHIRKAFQRVKSLQEQLENYSHSLPTVMIMNEREEPQDTHLLIRGEYDNKGEKVTRGVPECLPPLDVNGKNNRLALAKWIVDPNNPLTARVAVNRYWQMYFGNGLVETMEDFGSQGDWPSHPQLLDWLATEFIRTGWDVKAMQKLIVTSATYRQSSAVTPKRHKTDPQNRLLSRGPRVRLSAHAIRDQALFLGGLLVEKTGGPSVKPYQPPGLWQELAGKKYVADKGEKLYRRSLYIFWKRTIAPPSMMTFDAAGRESCVVRQSRTNTPLQALNLLNDVAYIEAARKLAERMMIEGGRNAEKRIAWAFTLATSRPPNKQEMTILTKSFAGHLKRYRNNPKQAVQLLQVGQAPRNPDLNVSELAAYTAIASVILNLDETITKQ